ncbi:MAG: DoxX family protein [Myxococcales bacterium]|nr:DoxX family protein [Myxococcales bacterium]
MRNTGQRITYSIATVLLSLLMLASASMYLLNPDEVAKVFTALGYPTYLVYPLAIAKLLGLTAIWTRKSITLAEWAYAGFFFDFILASLAHWRVEDGSWPLPFVALALLLTSYATRPRP